MGRHRMISDSIWTDPKLAHLSSEDLLTNVMLLSNRDSNVIGVYQTMWRSVGAGLGWTEAQMLTKARDLATKGIIVIDEREGWVWVKNWWDHNVLRAAFVGNVAKKARSEFSKVPSHWKEAVYEWLLKYDEDGVCKSLLTPSEGASNALGTSSQGSDGNPTFNPTPNDISTTTTNHTLHRDSDRENSEVEAIVDAAVWATSKTKVITNEPGFRHKVMTRIRTSGANPADLQTLEAWRGGQAIAKSQALALQESAAEIEQVSIERTRERARLETAFDALDTAEQKELVSKFESFIGVKLPVVHKLFKKHGITSPVVRETFTEFMRTSPTFHCELNMD